MSYDAKKHDYSRLCSAVKVALGLKDDVWYRHTLKADVCGCALQSSEEHIVVEGSAQAAANLADWVKAHYDFSSVPELIERMHLNLAYTSEELREPYLYMGLYEPATRTITLNNSALSVVQEFIRLNGLDTLTPAEDIWRITLYHEIFHALEEETPDIYTRSRMLKRKALGIFPYRRGLSGASEVGAVHFSKCMAGIPYSPSIYERYLLLSLGLLSIDFLLPSV
jgi:hypothetical protein